MIMTASLKKTQKEHVPFKLGTSPHRNIGNYSRAEARAPATAGVPVTGVAPATAVAPPTVGAPATAGTPETIGVSATENLTAAATTTMTPHCNENPTYVFLFWE
jgi:hypothetical protein